MLSFAEQLQAKPVDELHHADPDDTCQELCVSLTPTKVEISIEGMDYTYSVTMTHAEAEVWITEFAEVLRHVS